jgi:beta-galactosidase
VLALLLVLVTQRQTQNFDHSWRFHLGDVAGAQETTFDDSKWRMLDVPHDWSIEGEFSEQNPAGAAGGALPGGIGWYRKSFVMPRSSGKLVFIEFDGVYRNSEVWINGRYLGKRPYGYSSFRYELTPHLHYGARNMIAVRVDNSQQPNSRWYSGSGMYRHVRLVTTDPVHVDTWGTYVTTPVVSADSSLVNIRTTIRNERHVAQPLVLVTVIYDSAGGEAGVLLTKGVVVPADSVVEIDHAITIGHPTLWSLERPYIYRAVSRVTCSDKTCNDDYTTTFGVRSAEFRTDSGFFLNGRHVKIRGICLHHDLGALGAAVNTRAIERQLEIMKAMGANALRTSHNPPAPELLDLTDRMGFIVLDEAFDMWKKEKTKYDYHLDWDNWHVRDLSDMVRRDRNHPSVFMWSIGNEVMEQWNDGDSTAAPIARELAGIVHGLDPTRPVTQAANNGSPNNPVFHAGALDLLGHNYHHEVWADFPTQYPGAKFIITEAMSALNSRGVYPQPSDSVAVYHTPYEKDKGPQPPANGRLSSYDNSYAFWGSLHEESLRLFEHYPFLSGIFIWQGIDYLGEPTPYEWPARSSYFGAVDLAGFPKDPFFLYQSVWTDRPMLHILPHWNWSVGDTVDVWAYTNAEEVELSLNGVSLGVKRKPETVSHLVWRVAYAPGTLRGVARTGGRVTATDEVQTAGAPTRITLSSDRTSLSANGDDLSFVTVTVLDSAGVAAPNAEPMIRFRITGAARIVAVDNGDAMSHTSFQAHHVRLFNGKALVIIRAGSTPGSATVTAESDELRPATLTVTTHR